MRGRQKWKVRGSRKENKLGFFWTSVFLQLVCQGQMVKEKGQVIIILMPLKANWFLLHCSGDPWVSSAFSLPVLGWGCCLTLYTDPNSAMMSRFPNSRSYHWSLWSSGTELTLKPQAENCQLPFSRQGSSLGIGRQSFVSSPGKGKERRFEGFPHSIPFCWCVWPSTVW